ncbi:SusC/RagA family TonB-linked outer membrane protein [Mangrovibacterium lignilyticum]|uniref:SusC/RagA family TonB-linked outer membrane protein n=1 Tax=Mangrovibacterium lignilyticum TaxID=2668052 RepID=UPI0013D185B6|nr:SusC/RagA family TonB-linked outer membrane protein [Mangrovibacterium lignilyticum]
MKKRLIFLFLSCLVAVMATAQDRTISGFVQEKATQDPLPGVTVQEKGTTNGTITDIDGKFTIAVKPGAVLLISFIGMDSQEIAVGNATNLQIQLEPSMEQVNEVVVTAMGIKKETKALGYAVQEVKGAELVKVKEPNLVNSLNGKIAGVNVTNSGGAPGSSSQIIIRGGTSLTGDNQPLFVVDGIPVDNSAVGGDSGTGGLSATSTYTANRGMDLNSDDIESISVLKGPAAAALYGLKAAAGAVIITTKKGKSGVPEVTVSSKVRLDVVNRYPEQQTMYGQGNGGVSDTGTASSWGAAVSGQTYDNMKEFFEPAWSYDVTGSVSGGNENGTYFISMNRSDQNGIVPTTDYSKNSFRFNGEQKKGWFTIGMNTNYVYSQTTKTLTGDGLYGSSGSGAMISLYNWPVNNNMQNWQQGGNRVPLLPDADPSEDVDNPYWTVNKNPITDDLHRFIGSGYATIDPTDWLTATYRLGVDHYNMSTRSIVYPGSAVADPYDAGVVTETQRENNILTSNFTISATKKVSDFNLGLMLGHNYEQTTYYRNKQQAIGLLSDFISINNADEDNKSFSNYRSTKRLYSIFGEFSADYKGIAYLSVTGRNDWSSTLAPENRSFFYPSVSGSFIVSQFFSDELKETLSFAKLRASWSQVGKDAPVYQTATYLDPPVSSIGGGYKNSYTGGNPNLKPETTESTEYGLDMRFLKGRIGVDFTYYDTRSKDQIISPRVSMATGYIFQYVNFGTVINKGVEVTLTGKPLQSKNWRWDTALNISHNNGTVTDLPDGITLLYVTDVQIGPAKSASIGEGDFLGLTGQRWQTDDAGTLILDSDTGQPITSTDATNIVGNREPDLLLGLNNSITYKNWNLSFLFDIRRGGDVYNATEYAMVYSGTSKETEKRGQTQEFSGVTVDSNTGEYVDVTSTVELSQDYYQNTYTADASHFITSVNWVRLRSASLTYSLPKSFCQKLGFVKSADLSLSGTNLLLVTNYDGMDPEVSAGGSGVLGAGSTAIDYAGVPATSSVAFGVNIKF